MKKTIFMLACSLLLLSCSKDEGTPNPNLEVNYTNLAGRWYFKETIRENGTVVPYTNLCPTSRDYIEIFSVPTAINNHLSNIHCQQIDQHQKNFLVFYETSLSLHTSGGEIPDCTVVKLTTGELHLQYKDYINPPSYEIKILVLTKI